MITIHKYITVGGHGTRLKNISSIEKQNLYFWNKRIIDHIYDIFPDAKVIGHTKTNNRKETLQQINDRYNVLIIDCDIIPLDINLNDININNNNVYVFMSNKNKYGSIIVENNSVVSSSEYNNLSKVKCSGVYFCKDLQSVIESMTDPNSIVSGMIGANIIMENTFKKLGDIEDYYEAIGLC
jgi:hypothetical protein